MPLHFVQIFMVPRGCILMTLVIFILNQQQVFTYSISTSNILYKDSWFPWCSLICTIMPGPHQAQLCYFWPVHCFGFTGWNHAASYQKKKEKKQAYIFSIEQGNENVIDSEGYKASRDEPGWYGGSMFASQQDGPFFKPDLSACYPFDRVATCPLCISPLAQCMLG